MNRRRVVIVNNEKPIATTMAMCLEHAGFDVQTFARGIDALEPLRANPPDVIILDQTNPPLNGTELFDRLVMMDAGCPPVMFVTPHAFEVQRTLGMRGTPAADYLPSPFSHRELVFRVRNLVD